MSWPSPLWTCSAHAVASEPGGHSVAAIAADADEPTATPVARPGSRMRAIRQRVVSERSAAEWIVRTAQRSLLAHLAHSIRVLKPAASTPALIAPQYGRLGAGRDNPVARRTFNAWRDCRRATRWQTRSAFRHAVVRRSWQQQQPVNWERVHRMPDHVRFLHEAHINAGFDCATCHGDVGNMGQVVQVRPLTMGDCVSCHRANNAPTECATCHK